MSDIGEQKLVAKGDDVCIAMDAEMFKDMFNLMGSLILSEVQVEIRDDSLYLHQFEETHTGMTIMSIPKRYFKILKRGKVIKSLRLSIGDIKKILSRLGHGDVVEFTITKTGRLHIEIQGKRTREFNLPLLESEPEERRVPKIPLNVRIKTTLEGILVAIEDAKSLVVKSGKKSRKNLLGQITFFTTPYGLKIESMSEDEMSSSSTTLTSGWDIMQFAGSQNQHVTIAIPLITDVIDAVSKVTNMVQIEYSTHMPMHLIVEMSQKDVILEFWFAPRVPVESGAEIQKEVKKSVE